MKKNDHKKNPVLKCTNNSSIKLLNIFLLLLWCLIMISNASVGNIFGWIAWVYVMIKIWLVFPDLLIYSDGIVVHRIGYKKFIHWDEIQYLNKHSLYTRIYPRGISFFVKIIFYQALMIMKWYDNYSESIKFIEENLAASTVSKNS